VVCGNNTYGGTYRLFDRVWKRHGIEFSFVDCTDSAGVEAAFKPQTRLVWLETPTNPLMQLADIRDIAARARRRGITVAVDNTFMTPYFQRPLELGADVVMHSVTKYLNGHSDMVGGALVTRDEGLAEKLRFLQNASGAVPGPMDCWLALRGTKTLAVRMDRHDANARALAEFPRGGTLTCPACSSPAFLRILSTRLPSVRRRASAE
jgi:cystathionine beta-lyase/cystathionine gamma-synthase